MSLQGLSAPSPSVVLPTITLGARVVDIVQTAVFYSLVAAGMGTPVVLAIAAELLR